MKRYGLLILTSLMTFTACGESNPPLEVEIDPVDSSQIKVHSDGVSAFYNSSAYDYTDARNVYPQVDAHTNLGNNLPIHLSWKSNDTSANLKLVLDDSVQKLEYTVKGEGFDFYNYKLNTTYSAHIEYGNYISKAISFITPNGFVRTINVEGVDNFRDLGGYGGIKQGLLYRSLTFENNTITGAKYTEITSNGIKELHNLGIKSEIDVRKEDERGDKYGTISGINYVFKPLTYGGNNVMTYKDNLANLKDIFDYMANRNNYPMVFHCIRGTDRTGAIAIVLKGLLGVEEEFLKKDFIFSDFYNIGSPVRLESIQHANPAADKLMNSLKAAEGDTLQEKIYNFLQSKIGVSKENIDSIIDILKESNE